MQNTVDELGEPDAHRFCRLGNQAVRRHPGKRVDFEKIVITLRCEAKINARVPFARQRRVCRACRSQECVGDFFVEGRRDDVLAGAVRVLVAIIVETRPGAYLEQRKLDFDSSSTTTRVGQTLFEFRDPIHLIRMPKGNYATLELTDQMANNGKEVFRRHRRNGTPFR